MRPACKGVVARAGLLNWLAQADTDDGKGDGLTSDDRKELATLRKEKRRLEVENEILRPGSAAEALAGRSELLSRPTRRGEARA